MAAMTSSQAGSVSLQVPPACMQVRHKAACPAAFKTQRCPPRQLSRRALSVRVQAATQANVAMPSWEQMQRQLVQKHKLQSVSAKEANELVNSGKYVLVDVRPPNIFISAHPEGAKSAPLFQGVTWAKPNFKKYLRAVAFLANGVTPVEENVDFLTDLEKAAEGKGVIVMCEAGGTMKPSPNFASGKASRSLKAAWKALASGKSDVKHLDGGVYGWYTAQLPFYGEYDKSNLGRTPNAAVEPKGQYYEEAQKALEAKRKQEAEKEG